MGVCEKRNEGSRSVAGNHLLPMPCGDGVVMKVPGWMRERIGWKRLSSGTDLFNMRIQTAAQRLRIEAIASQRGRHDRHNRRNRRNWRRRGSQHCARIHAKCWVHDAMLPRREQEWGVKCALGNKPNVIVLPSLSVSPKEKQALASQPCRVPVRLFVSQ